MPSGEIHATKNSGPLLQTEVPDLKRLGYVVDQGALITPPRHTEKIVDDALKRQWCTKRKPQSCWNAERPPEPPKDECYEPLPEVLVVKVRNIHPTPSLHELHVQHPELFGQKPLFTIVQYGYVPLRKNRYAANCQFMFKGAKIYSQETALTKSGAKLNAARAIIRKLKRTANVCITLKEESMRSAVDTSLEHPRCRLLHLHDTRPDLYPQPPSFRVIKSRKGHGGGRNSKYNNVICYFQVGTDNLRTVGAAHNKKQAIVQAARNMLQLLALPEQNDKNNKPKVIYTPADRTQTPWNCHFCKIFMTGRRPFLSHLMGKGHVKRLSELGLNAEVENSVLLELAEKAFQMKEEEKRNEKLKKRRLNKEEMGQKELLPTRSQASKDACPGDTSSDDRRRKMI